MARPSLQLQRWQVLEPHQRQQVLSLQISPEQMEFAGSIEKAVAACEAGPPDDVAGLAILEDNRVVGFVVLSRGAKQAAWAPEGAVALTAMRIDSREQGKGLGRAALELLSAWLSLNWPTTTTLALSVDEENLPGRRAYAAAGFTEYTEPKPGRIGIVRYLAKTLPHARGAA